MALKKSLAEANNFFEDLRIQEEIISEFMDRHRMTVHELQLLTIIYQQKEIQLRTIIQEKMMKNNQINKAVKGLYDLKMIDKIRVPIDERTVQLSVKEDKMQLTETLIKDFSHLITIFDKGQKDNTEK